jgi:hypothetical protein
MRELDQQAKAELKFLSWESGFGKYLRPLDKKTGQQMKDSPAFGLYHATPIAVIDAALNGVAVPPEVMELVRQYQDAKNAQARRRVLKDLQRWASDHQREWDAIAEEYFLNVVKPRCDNDPLLAFMAWLGPTQAQRVKRSVVPSGERFCRQYYEAFLNALEDQAQSGKIDPAFGPRARYARNNLHKLTKVKEPHEP